MIEVRTSQTKPQNNSPYSFSARRETGRQIVTMAVILISLVLLLYLFLLDLIAGFKIP